MHASSPTTICAVAIAWVQPSARGAWQSRLETIPPHQWEVADVGVLAKSGGLMPSTVDFTTTTRDTSGSVSLLRDIGNSF